MAYLAHFLLTINFSVASCAHIVDDIKELDSSLAHRGCKSVDIVKISGISCQGRHLKDKCRDSSRQERHCKDKCRGISPQGRHCKDKCRDSSRQGRHCKDKCRDISCQGRHLKDKCRDISCQGRHLKDKCRDISCQGRHLKDKCRDISCQGRHLKDTCRDISCQGRHLKDKCRDISCQGCRQGEHRGIQDFLACWLITRIPIQKWFVRKLFLKISHLVVDVQELPVYERVYGSQPRCQHVLPNTCLRIRNPAEFHP